jgi:hypothetical protein
MADRYIRVDHPRKVVDGVEIVYPSQYEYDMALYNSLADLGLTYKLLAEQARTGNFSCEKARELWLRIEPPEGAPDA